MGTITVTLRHASNNRDEVITAPYRDITDDDNRIDPNEQNQGLAALRRAVASRSDRADLVLPEGAQATLTERHSGFWGWLYNHAPFTTPAVFRIPRDRLATQLFGALGPTTPQIIHLENTQLIPTSHTPAEALLSIIQQATCIFGSPTGLYEQILASPTFQNVPGIIRPAQIDHWVNDPSSIQIQLPMAHLDNNTEFHDALMGTLLRNPTHQLTRSRRANSYPDRSYHSDLQFFMDDMMWFPIFDRAANPRAYFTPEQLRNIESQGSQLPRRLPTLGEREIRQLGAYMHRYYRNDWPSGNGQWLLRSSLTMVSAFISVINAFAYVTNRTSVPPAIRSS